VGRRDDLRRLKDAASAKIADADLAGLAGDAVVGAADLVEGAEAVAKRSGLTNKKGEISKLRVAKAAVRPRSMARKVFDATADEIRERRQSTEGDQPTEL
jgi:hypothetical protein